MNSSITGYAEGYYGRLLSWSERAQILESLEHYRLNCYFYAPKEDPFHRWEWRRPYSEQWRDDFREFCVRAKDHGVRVVAGVAPAIDFDFSHLPEGADFLLLVQKCKALLRDGADTVSLLMDDIDPDCENRLGSFESEGFAHAALANALASALMSVTGVRLYDPWADQAGATSSSSPVQSASLPSVPLWVTPRVYADELISDAPDYLPAFVGTLDKHHSILYCGSDVVARVIQEESSQRLLQSENESAPNGLTMHRVIYWDNLYANDYCPRRLFTGPWKQRDGSLNIVLNPTGMVHTDCLLLELMAKVIHRPVKPVDAESEFEAVMFEWLDVMALHGVPDAFLTISDYFNLPVFNSTDAPNARVGEFLSLEGVVRVNDVLSAIEECLWRWKTPLSREWYPYIFGLKHDLLTSTGQHPPMRVAKTQLQPLASHLLSSACKEAVN